MSLYNNIIIHKFEKFLLFFTLIDVLFAPYTFFLATTYSQFFIFLWFVFKNKKVFGKTEVNIYYGLLFFIGLSVFISIFTIPDILIEEYFVENIKRGLIIGMGVSYYFFFYYIFKNYKFIFEKWIFFFVIYVSGWGILYYLNNSIFFKLKHFFNPYDTTLSFLNIEYFFYRFNFIWNDPNNISYAMVGVVSFLIVNKKINNLFLIISLLILFFVLFLSMSGGGILAAIIVVPVAVLLRLINKFTIYSFIITTLSTIIVIFFTKFYFDKFSNEEIGIKSIERLNEKKEKEDPRLLIWKKAFENKEELYYILAGEGSVLIINDNVYSPHNGHIMFYFGYGLIGYLFYLYIVFRKSKYQRWNDYVYIFPFFMCFTLNIGIGELKFAALMYMIIAYSRTKYLTQNHQLL